MEISPQYGYLIGSLVFLLVWLVLYFSRKDLRREILVMSLLTGVLSVLTAYYWWTADWWHPQTITNTKIGLEDFIAGFATGGIMASIYEVLFKKKYYRRKLDHHKPGAMTILIILLSMIAWLFWIVGLTSFWASTIALIASCLIFFFFRRDLFINGLLSGLLIAFVSFFVYQTIIFLSPNWVQVTYDFQNLSGVLLANVPIEEFVFWFLAGFLFGPFYEYWMGEKLRKGR